MMLYTGHKPNLERALRNRSVRKARFEGVFLLQAPETVAGFYETGEISGAWR